MHVLIKSPMTRQNCEQLIKLDNSFSIHIRKYQTKAKLLLLKLLQLFARDVLVMKKLEIEKTKPSFIISVLKVDIIKVGLVFSISNFFITKTSLANNWRRKKIPSCSYHIVASTNPSRIEAHAGLLRSLMKGIFDPYVL